MESEFTGDSFFRPNVLYQIYQTRSLAVFTEISEISEQHFAFDEVFVGFVVGFIGGGVQIVQLAEVLVCAKMINSQGVAEKIIRELDYVLTVDCVVGVDWF